MTLSTRTYFLMLFVIQIVPLIYVVIFAYSYFPRPPYMFLEDANVAEILGINLTGGQHYVVVAFSPPVTLHINMLNTEMFSVMIILLTSSKRPD